MRSAHTAEKGRYGMKTYEIQYSLKSEANLVHHKIISDSPTGWGYILGNTQDIVTIEKIEEGK